MTDRFKFRVWSPRKKKYLSFEEYSYQFIDNDGELHLYPEAENFGCSFAYGDEVAEQNTGLKDRNGNLIYEGDILGGFYGGYVKWCDRCKSFNLFVDEECAACSGDVLWSEVVEDDGKLEVIGNVHKNPELME